MRELNLAAFSKAISLCLGSGIDFFLISGDLFNTAVPSIDALKAAVAGLRALKDSGIPVYAIAGSHDYSTSGKTILDVLEEAGLLANVSKVPFVVDPKTNARIAGISGRKGMLDKHDYETLSRETLEAEGGFRIFMFHTGIAEFKPEHLKDMDSVPLSLFPKNINYYAGGHIHHVYLREEPGYGIIVFPGPVFPNNFGELQDLKTGGLYLVDADEKNSIQCEFVPVKVCKVITVGIDCSELTVEEANASLAEAAEKLSFPQDEKTVVLLRLKGTLSSGKTSEIDYRGFFAKAYSLGAYYVAKNTASLSSKEFESIRVQQETVEDIERAILAEHAAEITGISDGEPIFRELMHVLNAEKEESESKTDYEDRIAAEGEKVLRLE